MTRRKVHDKSREFGLDRRDWVGVVESHGGASEYVCLQRTTWRIYVI